MTSPGRQSTDNQATLSIGAIAIQPGNNDAARSLILAATGDANNSGDSYFGLGILRSADGGNSWSLISTANSGTLSFTGLGGTRLAFSTANGQTSTAVAAMGASSEGLVDGAITNATRRGLYTTLDAGQSWTYDALSDPGGATDPTSATSVVYNDGASKFFAAIRYHGFYSSPDGITWTRLASQPGGAVKGSFPAPAMWLPLAAIVIGVSASGNRTGTKARQLSGCAVFYLMMMAFVSCAGVSGGGGGGNPPPPATYQITVTGTSSGTPPVAGQSTTVTLVVN